MNDIAHEINRLHRKTGSRKVEAGDARTMLLRRTYDAGIADVWDAVTSPERIARWFLPVSGELAVGGRYQLQGNAGGEILACEAPELLRVSWLYGPDPDFSEVEVRLAPDGKERTVLELEHVAMVPEEFWEQYGPGATGVGWDLGLLALDVHLSGGQIPAGAWETSDEGKQAAALSARAWGEASRAAGEPAALVAEQTAATTAFYTGESTAG
ncbi:SRPBCC family protein [Streptomyces sp. 549]|uniref:SRPBCC family protein n=1 Tax=Streptomyces sp. 549 TaxID=3049076 RepID=UPI0024C414AC|nr:SRPBCC family protein [Streptomyces sp. 549]MDK1476087.1 SRPBCC family protein [Streptomyces sp. 549]